MAIQAFSVHPKSSSDIYSQTSLPALLPKNCTHALNELGRLDGPSENDVGCTLIKHTVYSGSEHPSWYGLKRGRGA